MAAAAYGLLLTRRAPGERFLKERHLIVNNSVSHFSAFLRSLFTIMNPSSPSAARETQCSWFRTVLVNPARFLEVYDEERIAER